MLRRLMLAAALCTAAPGLSAQHAVPTPIQGLPQLGLTFTVTGFIQPGATGDLPLPAALLERITREPSLVDLETGPTPAGRAMMQIRFVFPDYSAFSRWYADQRTIDLLRDVRGRTAGGSFESYVSYRPDRPPHP